MKQELEYRIHNCHTHLFTLDYIPKYFLSKYIPSSVVTSKFFERIARMIIFRKLINRFEAFLFSSLHTSQLSVFNELKEYYPDSTKYVALTVDFDFMGAGKCKYDFMQQVDDLAKVAKTVNKDGERVLPYFCIDPRRENLPDLVRKYVEQHGYRGLKIYPALGFFPDDERLSPVYEYAQKYQIPIIAHCTPKNKNHFRTKLTSAMINKAKQIPNFDIRETKKNYDFAMYMTHPYWYSKLLEKYPNLKIDFAHFGGNEEWDKYLDSGEYYLDGNGNRCGYANWFSIIKDLLRRYKNTYADISFTVYDKNLYPLLKNLLNTTSAKPGTYSVKDKILFGSDFYMLQKDYRERRFGLDVRGYLTEYEYWLMAEINPKRFLKTDL